MFQTVDRFIVWIKPHAKTLDLFPQYIDSIYKGWGDYIWTAPFFAPFVLWWMLGNPPMWVIQWTLVAALVIAGYYAWRADRCRLMPKLAFDDRLFIESATDRQTYDRVAYVQVLPKCLTEGDVEQCEGHLLEVSKWTGSNWETMGLSEPLTLEWSFRDSAPRIIHPKVPQRLNVCRTHRSRAIELTTAAVPVKSRTMFKCGETYKFDITITAKDCPALAMSLSVRVPEKDWNNPIVERV